jgi:SNF2 family DNA or RNA helicase
MRSREADASEFERKEGVRRSNELTEMTKKFILRRTQEINSKFLPPKVEATVFCKMSPLQRALYQEMTTRYEKYIDENKKTDGQSLPLITNLKKVCFHPCLIYTLIKQEKSAFIQQDLLGVFPEGYSSDAESPQLSGKLHFLDRLLQEIRKKGKDKIVLISNFTETLEIVGNLLRERKIEYYQLDGSTEVKKRQLLVDDFNVPTNPKSTVLFLLTSV